LALINYPFFGFALFQWFSMFPASALSY